MEAIVPQNTTPCPVCGVPTLTVARRYGGGMVTLAVRSPLPCYQLVLHKTKDVDMAYAAPSGAYPEHAPLCHPR